MKDLAISILDLFNPNSIEQKNHRVAVLIAMICISFWVVSLLAIGFNLPFFIITMAIANGLVFIYPKIALPVILLSTFWFERWFTLQSIIIGDQIYKLYPLDIVFIIAWFAFAFHYIYGKTSQNKKIKIDKLGKIILSFMVICFGFFIWSNTNIGSDFALSFSAFKNYAFYALFYFFIAVSLQNKQDLKELLRYIFLGGFGLIGFVITGLIRGEGLWTEYTPLSTIGTRYLAFTHGVYLSLIMIIGLILYLSYLRSEKTTIITLWLQLIGVIGSLMRHLWIALFTATVVLFFTFSKTVKTRLISFLSKNFGIICVAFLIIASLSVLFPFSDLSIQFQKGIQPFVDRASSLANATYDSSARWRIYAWSAAADSIIANPIVGIGYGQNLIIEFDTFQTIVPIRELHNSLLVIVVQMGLIGSIVFGYLLFTLAKEIKLRYKKHGLLWPYQLAFIGALILLLSASIWQPYFETNLTGIFFWILLGIIMRISYLEDHDYSTN